MLRILEAIGKCLDTAFSCALFNHDSERPDDKAESNTKQNNPIVEDTEAIRSDWEALYSDLRKAVYRVVR